jgi:hypothetical protein
MERIENRVNTSKLIVTTTATNSTSFGIILLTKDDVDVLPTWLSYLYYTMKLRHVILAVHFLTQEMNQSEKRFRSQSTDPERLGFAQEWLSPQT